MPKYKLLLRTIVHLRLKQIVYQLKYRITYSKLRAQKVPSSIPLRLVPFIAKWRCYDNDKTFTFLNLSSGFTFWNDTRHGMLWAYNLNYMDWLLQEGMSVKEGTKWIDRFIKELPQNRIGLDPYPIALRSINWIKFISIYRNELTDKQILKWNNSLYAQCRLLERKLEHHLLGNHLLEDAYTLFIVSSYFSDKKLYGKASRLLLDELKEQVLPDGAHYEQSPMYHCILLDRLLDCYNVAVCTGQDEMRESLRQYAVRMLGHLESIVWKDDTIPLLNDSAYGIAPIVSELRAYAKRLALEWKPVPMKECGYRKLCSTRFETIVDVGNIAATYQPGHSHADTFNYELKIDGKSFIVDAGISTYNKTERRQYERSTAAHNTVTVDGKDSSEVWGGFRVGNRAKVTMLEDTDNQIKASHNGFGKKGVHTRTFRMDMKSFTIIDDVSSNNQAISYIHLAPEIEVKSVTHEKIVTNRGIIHIRNAQSVKTMDEKISTAYNLFHSIKTIKILFTKEMEYMIESNLKQQ